MTDISELVQTLKVAAEKASVGDWVKESGDGWDAICSNYDQTNGGFIIAHFEGPDAAVNRKYVQSANPANIIALTVALEKAQGRIAELEAITVVGDQVAGEDAERREWMARGVEKSIELISAHSWDKSESDGIVAATDAMEIIAAKIRAGEVEL